jgi:hypothetical protein
MDVWCMCGVCVVYVWWLAHRGGRGQSTLTLLMLHSTTIGNHLAGGNWHAAQRQHHTPLGTYVTLLLF